MFKSISTLLVAGISVFAFGCGGSTTKLTMLCKSKVLTAPSNKVSFVFKAELDDENKTPITDLDTVARSSFVIDDGGNVSGGESTSIALARPQNVRLRTLILLDGSGSLYTADGQNEKRMKTAVEAFINTADVNSNVVGIYMFHGTQGTSNVLEPIHAFDANRNSREMILADLDRATIIKQYTSTALHDAIQASINLLNSQNDANALVMIKSLVLFTDGKDEVYSGSTYTSSRNQAISAASDFKKSSDANSIFAAAMKPATGGTYDDELLSTIASSGSNKQIVQDLTKLSSTFEQFARDAEKQAKKYYQFNMCSNRRGQSVDARLKVLDAKYESNEMNFSYDASSFKDPMNASECSPESLELFDRTCDWSPSSN